MACAGEEIGRSFKTTESFRIKAAIESRREELEAATEAGMGPFVRTMKSSRGRGQGQEEDVQPNESSTYAVRHMEFPFAVPLEELGGRC